MIRSPDRPRPAFRFAALTLYRSPVLRRIVFFPLTLIGLSAKSCRSGFSSIRSRQPSQTSSAVSRS